jgi:hypothetical protein
MIAPCEIPITRSLVVESGDRWVAPCLPQKGVHLATVLKLFLNHVDQQLSQYDGLASVPPLRKREAAVEIARSK